MQTKSFMLILKEDRSRPVLYSNVDAHSQVRTEQNAKNVTAPLSRDVDESPSLKVFTRLQMCCVEIGSSSGLSSVRLAVRLNDPKGLLQSKRFCDSMITFKVDNFT